MYIHTYYMCDIYNISDLSPHSKVMWNFSSVGFLSHNLFTWFYGAVGATGGATPAAFVFNIPVEVIKQGKPDSEEYSAQTTHDIICWNYTRWYTSPKSVRFRYYCNPRENG